MTTLPAAPPTHARHVDHQVTLTLEEGERWWGGAVDDGVSMPFGARPFSTDLGVPVGFGRDDARASNQSAPVLLSTRGRVVWSGRPFSFTFNGGTGNSGTGDGGTPDGGHLTVTGTDLLVQQAGTTLRDAFLASARDVFPPSGRTPAPELFTGPQYNSWIEQPYTPTQESVLRYVRALLDSGMPPGVVMIDDCWAPDYGTWRFDAARFPDPAAMVAELHDLGCSVMLWLVPFISPDSAAFRELEGRGLLIRSADGQTAIRRWWNGFSALLDLTHPEAVHWLTTQLDDLVENTGVDGFKFDAGDVRDYRPDDLTFEPAEPVDMCERWARIGLRYPFNEYRACWRMGGQPLGQRLQDKRPTWDAHGIGSLVPEMLAQGMIGHPFTCPDMIGGGEISSMTSQAGVDQEFFVRYAQIAALSPMMQFSVSPARVLDAEHLAAVRAALALREELLPTIMGLVDEAARTGEPVVRPMAYHAPSLEDVSDQFFLGPNIIGAPIVERGATVRRVTLPEGTWQSNDGGILTGPAEAAVECSLASIPLFRRIAG
ncbi:glycoside hydrolase family 31 protein [Pseudarthrobacter sp. J64]|uniref:glycoside hydrolase family 31 protein n=1 Tax=Pseudarthrobacter sp. J64 TaxID=3116485 RepID=UPI002E806ABC|nr:glycoside hydrolase family 31 protein [Pseudarthrobacter sp. J64]MEE2569940.1 glycoside hydrolase family 31 protein [Pseudarthrobacter sp. J64]